MFMYFFTTKSRGFAKILKVKFCVFESALSSHSENVEPVTRDNVQSSQMRNETSLQF